MTREEARKLVRELFLKTLPHLQAGPKMRQMVRLRGNILEIGEDRVPLHEGRPVRVVAMGKAANDMVSALAEILPGVRLRGVVAAPEIPRAQVPGFEYFAGGHPYPNEQSRQAAEAALALLDHQRSVPADDLVIFLNSGGGSSLMELPPDPSISLEDLRRFYEVLVTCGASIQEINTVRKHFSNVKGGRLAQLAWPARQITLYVSDVPEHLPSMVASGPTMPDETTQADLDAVILRAKLADSIPSSYRELWHKAAETPKPGDQCFERSRYYCLLSNWNAVETLVERAEAQGIAAEPLLRSDDWDFGRVADSLLKSLALLQMDSLGKPVAIISGGELSCPVTGDGMGGRNQAFVLDCVSKIAGQPIVVLSYGTDGIDGNSPAAGAIADGETLARAKALSLDPAEFQRRSDSYHFFEKLGDAIVTGPTGTNVRDLRILLAYPA
jgi:hydroxypyruvate reductase